MAMKNLNILFCLALALTFNAGSALAQTESGSVFGRVSDSSDAIVVGAEIQLTSLERGTLDTTRTNNSGLYIFSNVHPGRYALSVRKPGFRQVDFIDLVVNVQTHTEQNFRLKVGSVSESVTVHGGTPLLETENGTVSTVVDRQFAENLPLNGRSFQTLIQLTPGVVTTPVNTSDGGQFSVNGQRPSSNYWTVDGVSANIGISANAIGGNGYAGALPSFGAQGGTNSLVSVDAMQEFRIQTSSYAPEFGRAPGAQISIATRSGANQVHGALFDYVRNDVFDANDWFAANKGLEKPRERHNDFGGTFSGPLLKDRTFFFFSYEGLRLRLPQVDETLVPDLSARQNAIPAMQPFLEAFPLPNGPEAIEPGLAQFNAAFSNSSSLDAYSLRVDHRVSSKLSVFARYNYSPSHLFERGSSGGALAVVSPLSITTQTATAGSMWMISQTTTNDFRFNYSKTDSAGTHVLDSFGGAKPLSSLPFPASFTSADANFALELVPFATAQAALLVGKTQRNVQHQINFVDSLSSQVGAHNLKFGIDFRRLSPVFSAVRYGQGVFFDDVPSAENGNISFADIISSTPATLLFRNLGLFAQDSWRALPGLSVTYGIRWDVDFAPASLNGPSLLSVTGFDLTDSSRLALARAGTPPFKTTYGNIAPRIGVAYQLSTNQDWATVVRGGVGLFYDLATQEVGNVIHAGTYPFGATNFLFGTTFPFSTSESGPPAIVPTELQQDTLYAFDPHLRLPYSVQWNVAIEQELGKEQSFTASYIGSAGHRLERTSFLISTNPSFAFTSLVGNAATSTYNALQLQMQRRLLKGLQSLVSYTWSHSIDNSSAGSFGNEANGIGPGPDSNRGPSDFDIRHALSLAFTYQVPAVRRVLLARALTSGWSFHNVFQARSAPPVTLYDSSLFQLRGGLVSVRPDIVPGVPVYVTGSQCVGVFGETCPGGKGLNPAAFSPPPVDVNGDPLRQGTLSRNALRGFGAAQWDIAVHRDFPIRESLVLQFRAEIFNVLNHPNFGPPVGDIADTTQFGRANQMLGQSLAGPPGFSAAGSGAFNPLYQIGSPRSMQLALKLTF